MSLLVSDHFKTQEMCNEAVRNNAYIHPFKTEEMSDDAVEASPWQVKYVPDQYKTQKMYDEAVIDDSSSLQYVPDWFVTSDWVRMWYVDSEYRDYDDEVNSFKWYDSYKTRKAQKASIKEELLPIAWRPSRYWDWCISEDKNERDRKIVEVIC